MCYHDGERALVIATPDTPLISMGPLKAHEVRLCGENGLNNLDEVYAWVMNNFWETNFKADLGGFHQYRYSLMMTAAGSIKEALSLAEEMTTPPPVFLSCGGITGQ
jgi:hypothetical protein